MHEEDNKRLEQLLTRYLTSKLLSPQPLAEAMRYAVLNGGKRLRPRLVYATGQMLGASLQELDAAACAVELIHAYSLIHDDLPILDDDEQRRGQPSCHKVFGEAMTLLAGDALQALAFEVLTKGKLPSDIKLKMIALLSKAIGAKGMASGQAMEFVEQHKKLTVATLEKIHRLKTGELIRASIELGATVAQASAEQHKQLKGFAICLGLAYQIQDDIDDRDQTEFNYITQTHLARAKHRVHELYEAALQHLQYFNNSAGSLINLLNQIIVIR